MSDLRIAVLGSVNMDLVHCVPRLPKAGETLRALSAAKHIGGKGANQAVAAARMGAAAEFFGAVGMDAHGDDALRGFEDNCVDASSVRRIEDVQTGTASIWVGKDGENAIVISSGANAHVTPSYVDDCLDKLAQADVLLLQFEVPHATIKHVLQVLPPGRPKIVLDPAPVAPLDGLNLSRLYCITPNEEELAQLSGARGPEEGARALQERGIGHVICTLGSQGAYALTPEGNSLRASAYKVDAKDTTASGDAFAAALAVACGMNGTDLGRALQTACAAGALAATRVGAWPSLPTRKEVERLLQAAGKE